MTVVDAGHDYLLDALDGDAVQRIVFVKREGAKYPGNVGHHSGTTTQEVLRACIDRLGYVNNQIPCPETESARELLRVAVWLLECRAARCHERFLTATVDETTSGAGKCATCGHVGCDKH